jgi:biotin transport system substrate-specific component
MTYAEIFRPAVGHKARIFDIACVVGGSAVLALSALISVRLPFGPVPVTAQTLAVLLLGAVLGKTRAVASVFLYLAQGLAGLPVFAGGTFGAAYLLGPTGGYLIGFVPAAFIAGYLAEHGWDRKVSTAFLAMLAGNIAIYVCGIPWLANFVGADKAIALGFLPFIPGDLIKLVLATAALPMGWKVIHGLKGE